MSELRGNQVVRDTYDGQLAEALGLYGFPLSVAQEMIEEAHRIRERQVSGIHTAGFRRFFKLQTLEEVILELAKTRNVGGKLFHEFKFRDEDEKDLKYVDKHHFIAALE